MSADDSITDATREARPPDGEHVAVVDAKELHDLPRPLLLQRMLLLHLPRRSLSRAVLWLTYSEWEGATLLLSLFFGGLYAGYKGFGNDLFAVSIPFYFLAPGLAMMWNAATIAHLQRRQVWRDLATIPQPVVGWFDAIYALSERMHWYLLGAISLPLLAMEVSYEHTHNAGDEVVVLIIALLFLGLFYLLATSLVVHFCRRAMERALRPGSVRGAFARVFFVGFLGAGGGLALFVMVFTAALFFFVLLIPLLIFALIVLPLQMQSQWREWAVSDRRHEVLSAFAAGERPRRTRILAGEGRSQALREAAGR